MAKTSNEYKHNKVPADKLYWTCPENIFKFKSTKELTPLDEIIGQDRAIEAIKLGAKIQAKGYNIFVTGLSGTGRLSTVQQILNDIKIKPKILYDYCYVNNFRNESEPILLKFEQGGARKFSKQMQDLIAFLRNRLPKLFEEEKFQEGKKKIITDYQENDKNIYLAFDKEIETIGFVRSQYTNEQGTTQMDIFPVVDGSPIIMEDLEQAVAQGKIPPNKAQDMMKVYPQLRIKLYELIKKSYKLLQEFRKNINDYDQQSALLEIKVGIDVIKQYYPNNLKISNYLDDVTDYIINHLNLFIENPQSNVKKDSDHEAFRIFSVNIILDNSDTTEVPVIVETTPTFSNLFGTIEIERVSDTRTGFWNTDFTKIKAGSILKANQGFLIVNCDDLFSEAGSWNALKRVLLYNQLEIMNYDNYFQISQAALKPEPIDVDLKVVIIGGDTFYQALYHGERGFKKIFKIHSQFDNQIKHTDNILLNYARFLTKISKEDNLPYCDPSGVAAIIEWAVAASESQNQITLKFTDVADVLRESSLLIKKEGELITRKHVESALKNRAWRNNLLDSKIKENIEEGYTLIDTDGERIGQINALTVYSNGINSFGKPARITATVSPGNNGIINIEREASLSGDIHNKGMLIISAFLREKFACESTMSFTATIAFEQSYGGVDGDSASLAEIYSLLSALSQTPISQSFAITGSVNQKGDIQPIGGVNEKITGFFEICRDRGFTGKQGVLIPYQNVQDLMLNKEIVEAVKQKKFTIYALNNIDEGARILMNTPTGERNSKGNFPRGTLYYKVIERIKKLSNYYSKTNDNLTTKKNKN